MQNREITLTEALVGRNARKVSWKNILTFGKVRDGFSLAEVCIIMLAICLLSIAYFPFANRPGMDNPTPHEHSVDFHPEFVQVSGMNDR